jgi:copper(I)-binding protein
MRSSRLSWRSSATVLAISFAIISVGLAGCATGGTSAPTAVAPAVTDAWVRVPTGTGQQTAAYLTIANNGSDTEVLTAISSPGATGCTLHETSMDSSGMAGMHMVGRLEIPGHGMVKLEPGGYHVMMDGVGSLKVGDKVELQLTFQRAGIVKVMAEVRAG